MLHFVRDSFPGGHPEARKLRGTPRLRFAVTKNRLGATAGGFAQKHFEYSLSPVWAVAVIN
jgi:hypothetical protein